MTINRTEAAIHLLLMLSISPLACRTGQLTRSLERMFRNMRESCLRENDLPCRLCTDISRDKGVLGVSQLVIHEHVSVSRQPEVHHCVASSMCSKLTCHLENEVCIVRVNPVQDIGWMSSKTVSQYGGDPEYHVGSVYSPCWTHSGCS